LWIVDISDSAVITGSSESCGWVKNKPNHPIQTPSIVTTPICHNIDEVIQY
jgi:hypothetical protein